MIDIYPFNDFFYVDCFYNHLFSIMKYYDRNVLDYLCEDKYTFSIARDRELGVAIDYGNVDIKNSLLQMGIIIREIFDFDSILSNIFQALENRMPVIIKLDAYYETIRTDVYCKEHLDHSILVYGYHKETNEFLVYEHNYKNSLRYINMRISEESLLNSIAGYKNNFGIDLALAYVVFENNEFSYSFSCNKVLNKLKETYLNLDLNYVMTLGKIKSVNDVINKMTITNDKVLANQLIFEITEIINAKKVQKYILYNCFLGNEIIDCFEKIISHWVFLRLCIINFQLDGIEVEKKMKDAVNIIDIIFEEEILIVDKVKNALEDL